VILSEETERRGQGMDVLCSFYIGHQDYLGEDPDLSEAESRAAVAASVNEVVTRNLGQDQSSIQPAINPDELSATLTFSGQTIAARGFSTETAVADDQDGLPVLYYVNAYFSVPADLEDAVTELEDSGELDDEIRATLSVASRSFSFEGAAELVFE
jgi:hypothetical protein